MGNFHNYISQLSYLSEENVRSLVKSSWKQLIFSLWCKIREHILFSLQWYCDYSVELLCFRALVLVEKVVVRLPHSRNGPGFDQLRFTSPFDP